MFENVLFVDEKRQCLWSPYKTASSNLTQVLPFEIHSKCPCPIAPISIAQISSELEIDFRFVCVRVWQSLSSQLLHNGSTCCHRNPSFPVLVVPPRHHWYAIPSAPPPTSVPVKFATQWLEQISPGAVHVTTVRAGQSVECCFLFCFAWNHSRRLEGTWWLWCLC
jgi:hypothetical protein